MEPVFAVTHRLADPTTGVLVEIRPADAGASLASVIGLIRSLSPSG
jgi:hypothetical protein